MSPVTHGHPSSQTELEFVDYTADGASFAASFDQSKEPPFKGDFIITCADRRMNTFLNAVTPGAIIMRNAGGSVKETLRSLVVAQELGFVSQISIIHHTDCYMTQFTTASLRESAKKSAESESPWYQGSSDEVAKALDDVGSFEEIVGGVEEGVRRSVRFLREHPLVGRGVRVEGWILDLETGKVDQVVV